MTTDPLEDQVKHILFQVAPDLEGETIDAVEPLRDQFEIDSMDFLNFVIGLNKATGVPIAETDYPRLETLQGCVEFLKEKGAAA